MSSFNSEKINELCKCAVYPKDSEMYTFLTALGECEWDELVQTLGLHGYGINYNILDDCYVIY